MHTVRVCSAAYCAGSGAEVSVLADMCEYACVSMLVLTCDPHAYLRAFCATFLYACMNARFEPT